MAKSKNSKDGGGKNWLSFFTEANQTCRVELISSSAGAPTPVEDVPIRGERYLRIRLLSFHIPYSRKALTRYQPVVFASANWKLPMQGEMPQTKIISPSMQADTFGERSGVFAFGGTDLFGPVLLNGALNLRIGLLVNKSSPATRKILDGLASAADLVTTAGLLKLDFLTNSVSDKVDKIAQALLPNGPSDFLVGTIMDLPEAEIPVKTGTWAVLAPSEKSEQVSYDSENNLLLDTRDQALKTPYIVYSIEALTHNPDRERIPEIIHAKARLDAAVTDSDANSVTLRRCFLKYLLDVEMCDGLTRDDKDVLLAQARNTYGRVNDLDDFLDKALAGAGQLESTDATYVSLLPGDADAAAAISDSDDEVVDALSEDFAQGASMFGAALQNSAPDEMEAGEGAMRAAIDKLLVLARRDAETAEPKIVEVAERLRKIRSYDILSDLEQDARHIGIENVRLSYLAAFAHIERGDLDEAQALASQVLVSARRSGDQYNQSELLALFGRIWKTRAVNALAEGDKSQAKAAFSRAIGYYSQGDLVLSAKDPNDPYHRVNIMALMQASERAGMPVGPRKKSKRWAKAILTREETRNDEAEYWDLANAGDACLAQGKLDQAVVWYQKYIAAAIDNPFAINATRRQLIEMWGIDPAGSDELAQIVRDMGMISVAKGDSVSLTGAEIKALVEAPGIDRLEGLFEGPGGIDVKDLLRALQLGEHVAKVCKPNGRVKGTGFLLDGGSLNEAWSGEKVLLTNAHVISNDPNNEIALRSTEARVFFEQIDADEPYQIKEVLWESEISQHDCTVCRLFVEPITTTEPFEIARGLPPRWKGEAASGYGDTDEAPRVYVMGHPDGDPLTISVHRNFLIDHEYVVPASDPPVTRVRLHYRAPTAGGSSGSPILNARTLQLIGIHHAESSGTPLNDQKAPHGTKYEANEGLWIQAIRANIAEKLGGNDPSSGSAPPIPAQAANGVSVADQTSAPEQALESADSEPEFDDMDEAFADNIEARRDTAETGYGLEDVGLEASSADWRALPVKPSAVWTDEDYHPDTRHLADVNCAGAFGDPFELSSAVLRKALEFASIPVEARWGDKVLFGIRAALPAPDVEEGHGSDFHSSTTLVQTTPDHVDFKCTMGVWDTATDQVWISRASTVPAIGYMWRQAEGGPRESVCNLMPPGVYKYVVGTHANGKSSRQPGAFRQASKLCVLRSRGNDYTFTSNDDWDWVSDAGAPSIWDNIHSSLTPHLDWIAKFYSAGCQVLPGNVRQGRTRPSGAWQSFRAAAGLTDPPHVTPVSGVSNSRVVKTDLDGKSFRYVLLSSKEVRLASQNMDAPTTDPRFAKLRRGSKGDDVRLLQKSLGISADGDFGFLTQRALLNKQMELHGEADGVVTASQASLLGITNTPSEPMS